MSYANWKYLQCEYIYRMTYFSNNFYDDGVEYINSLVQPPGWMTMA